ncbi:hypothetical protein BN14_05694 [Rhizoctonia solani AG-1 IB]|uniref:Uncharacterized protein n=1 Tax=Thanatephorus cucumeris (strain AG1-IB / isolate 7/3/14) TaxID=1108050 RepID=M5C718_THACB|nr:hypothetical protein BN14_05694 [Rhizoctonia solani AG-1 IB]
MNAMLLKYTRSLLAWLPYISQKYVAPLLSTKTWNPDEFERSFAIRWLTGFIARGEEWTELYTDEEGDLDGGAPATSSGSAIGRFQTEFLDDTSFARMTAFDRAAALLGACAGTSASGVLSRDFKFATSPVSSSDSSTLANEDLGSNSSPITITLRDESISTGDHTAVGLQTWGFRTPRFVFEHELPTKRNRSKVERAHSAAKVDSSNFTIVATDYHPAVLANLRANAQNNFPESNHNESLVDVRPLDWSLYLTGKPTTDLSRAPSTAPTPSIGTPINGSERNGASGKSSPLPRLATPGTQTNLISESVVSPPIQTPSFSVTSSASTPATSYSPQTPQTPRTVRSPPPNLARAVFSRLIARGLKFEMPGGPPGLDQTSELTKKPVELEPPNTEEDFLSQNLGPIPVHINFEPSIPSIDFDIPKSELGQLIETEEFSSARISNGLDDPERTGNWLGWNQLSCSVPG